MVDCNLWVLFDDFRVNFVIVKLVYFIKFEWLVNEWVGGF